MAQQPYLHGDLDITQTTIWMTLQSTLQAVVLTFDRHHQIVSAATVEQEGLRGFKHMIMTDLISNVSRNKTYLTSKTLLTPRTINFIGSTGSQMVPYVYGHPQAPGWLIDLHWVVNSRTTPESLLDALLAFERIRKTRFDNLATEGSTIPYSPSLSPKSLQDLKVVHTNWNYQKNRPMILKTTTTN